MSTTVPGAVAVCADLSIPTMLELPRITRAIRAHTYLDEYHADFERRSSEQHGAIPRNSTTRRRRSQVRKKRFRTFQEIYEHVHQKEQASVHICKQLDMLRSFAMKIAEGYQYDLIQDMVIVILRMFLDSRVVTKENHTQLRQLLGDVSREQAERLREIVSEISQNITEETKTYIMARVAPSPLNLWGNNFEFDFENEYREEQTHRRPEKLKKKNKKQNKKEEKKKEKKNTKKDKAKKKGRLKLKRLCEKATTTDVKDFSMKYEPGPSTVQPTKAQTKPTKTQSGLQTPKSPEDKVNKIIEESNNTVRIPDPIQKRKEEDKDNEISEILSNKFDRIFEEHLPPPSPLPVKFGRDWIEQSVLTLFPKEDYVAIMTPILRCINSTQTDEEIQNDLFDLLGFEKIEFIQDLLVHRREIVANLKAPDPAPPPPAAPVKDGASTNIKKLIHMHQPSKITVEDPSSMNAHLWIITELRAALPKKRHNKKWLKKVLVQDKPSMPTAFRQVTVQSESEKLIAKLQQKEAKKAARKYEPEPSRQNQNMYIPLARERMSEIYQKPKEKPIPEFDDPVLRKIRYSERKVQFPNVYDSSLEARNAAGYLAGQKVMLPANLVRKETKEYEEVIIPKCDPPPLQVGNKRIQVAELDDIGKSAFENIKELNRIQSVVFQTAYTTNENLLICAPTGAGKTNIALLTVVHQIKQYIENDIIQKDKFKIIYIAPMKALASEMTASFGKRLAGLGICVRELTGDMKLSRTEIMQTQMIVTTPEKWDVVTRKGATESGLTAILKLLIIDEVHLLHGDRGPIIEAVVARTLRQVETSQTMIRIVGLSATLPNYLDVATFLRVNPNIGLFFFDSRFRPVPLEQQFVGVKEIGSGGGQHIRQLNAMNEICYEKAFEMVQKGHQVMVFVHARNATNNTAMVLKEIAQKKGHLKYFEPEDNGGLVKAKKSIASSSFKQLSELFACGFACHHAGMLRSDRNLVEKYFAEGYIRVLVCTSTLAWGVNLPAHAVVIRGTELYDQNRGTFVDLSILDVLQIFGRAGRPQFDTSGTGIIITTHDKLSHYLQSMTNQVPIESNFISLLADHLNAEIALGTVSNISEAVEWLSYTYLFVRMRINPQVYGLNYHDVHMEPMLETKRTELVIAAAKELDKAMMIRYDDENGELHTTDLGRSASHYYITMQTMKVFNRMVKKAMTKSDVLRMLSRCSDFAQLKVRKEEIFELRTLQSDHCEVRCEPPIGEGDIHWKVQVLLQTFLSRGRINASSLQSDLNYISQNAVRIVRALFEITLRKNNALMAALYLKMAKMLELQLWDFHSEMRQFNCFPEEVLRHIEFPMMKPDMIREMDYKELGSLVRNMKAAKHLKKCAEEFPLVDMEASLQPITRTVIKIRLMITPNFKWNDKYHGKAPESFWVWVEDPESDIMYYHEYFQLSKKQVVKKETQELIMTIPIMEPMPSQYYVRASSDRWLGADSVLTLTFQDMILPETYPPHTKLQYLRPVPITALRNEAFQSVYNFTHFNPIQTQLFHTLYHSEFNVLLGAPTGCGKTIVAEIAMFRAFRLYPGCKVVYIAPLKALVKERVKDWKDRFERQLGLRVVELTGDSSPEMREITRSRVIVTTPEKWDGISRSWQQRQYVQNVVLMIIDEIHLLGEDRGPVLEVIVSRANFIMSHTKRNMRIIGLSTPLANANDLAHWLNIEKTGLYNFQHYVRPVPLQIHVSGYPGRHYCPRMLTMNKPTYQAIRTHAPRAPALVFVSSRRQTRLTALDLIAFLAAETDPKQWLHMAESEMEQLLAHIKDQNLKLTLAFGIGLHHAGLHERDRNTVEELFVNQKIQVLICTSTLAWGVNFPAHLVVVKGTEYFCGKQKRYVDMPITDVLQMMGRAGRPQFDNMGVAVVLVHDQKKNFYKKFFYEPFPVESNLLEVLPEHLNAEIVAGQVVTKDDILEYMTWTYFYRRLMKNPSYYSLENLEPYNVNFFMESLIGNALEALQRANCVEVLEDDRAVRPTWIGCIASYYYLSYKTMAHFHGVLTRDMTVESLLRALADCAEYAELPVRHNEDVLNGELATQVPLRVDPLTLDNPNVKAFLLLQAHMSRATLPNSDYLTDTKSVLDQTIRILQAMIDMTAEFGWLAACLQCMQLMQGIVQARWPKDSPFTTLPGVEPQHLYMFANIAKATRQKQHTILNGLKVACANNVEFLAKHLRKEFDQRHIMDIHKVLCDMPTLNVRIDVKGVWFDSAGEQVRALRLRPPTDWVPLHADQEYTLVVSVERRGGHPSAVFCPYFPKGKNEGWALLLGTVDSGQLHAVRRLHARTTQLSFHTPAFLGRVIYTLYVMSDCYIGLDQQYNLQFELIDPLPEEAMMEAYDPAPKALQE